MEVLSFAILVFSLTYLIFLFIKIMDTQFSKKQSSFRKYTIGFVCTFIIFSCTAIVLISGLLVFH